MTTWADLQDHVRDHLELTLDEDEDDHFARHRIEPEELVEELLYIAAYGDNIEERRATGDNP